MSTEHRQPRTNSSPRRPSRPSGTNRLPDSKKIAFAVAEPRASLTDTLAGIIPGDLGDAINGLQTGQIIFLELNSPRAKLAHGCIDILHLPAHLRVRAGLHSGRDEYRK